MRRVIIAGGRDFTDFDFMWERVCDILTSQDIVVSGTARGADKLGERCAAVASCKVEQYPADWDKHGKAAGHRRNYAMARASDVLCAFWDGESPGTRNMIDTALREGLEVHVWRYQNS